MQEIINKRSLNSKHFLDNGETKMHAHSGHIHYWDKLDSKRFREIDWTLNFDNIKRGWYFNYHSFRPFLPEYSDGYVEFRDLFDGKDQTIKYKAVCDRVIGELIETDSTDPNFDNNINNKAVLYRNAFGRNKDYILYHTRSSLIKVATVNDPGKQKADIKFKWEVQLPKDVSEKELPIYRTDVKETLVKELLEKELTVADKAYKLDTTKEKIFDTAKQTLIGSNKLDGKEWFTYLKNYKAWDSERNAINIEARIFVEDGKLFLEKTIPLSFLQNAVGRVFTDTTTSYYAGANDGYVASGGGSNWSTQRNLTDGASFSSTVTGAGQGIATRFDSPDYQILRSFFDFDLSTDSGTVTAVDLKIHGYAASNAESNTVVQEGTQTTNLANADYDAFTGASLGSVASWINSGYNTISLNSSGISYVNNVFGTATLAKFCAREKAHDFDDSAPATTYRNSCYYSEQTGTDEDPYLSVTYTTGHTFTGDANLKSVESITFTGDTNLKTTVSVTFTGDANLKSIESTTFTGDASLKSIESATFTGDSFLETRVIATYTGDTNLKITLSSTFTGDANLKLIESATFTGDANLKSVELTTFTGDANLKITKAVTFTGDAILANGTADHFTGDSSLKSTESATFTGDARLKTVIESTFTGDSKLLKVYTFTGDANLNAEIVVAYTGDANLKTTLLSAFTGDASLKSIESLTFTSDANLKEEIAATFTGDAVLKIVIELTFTSDSNLLKVYIFTGDANLRKISTANFAGIITLDNKQQSYGFGFSGGIEFPLR